MSFKPTPAQQTIIDFVNTNPTQSVVVDARAGAAKTSTIVLAAQKIGPQFTPLAVAFNKKIAEELSSRLPAHFTCATLNALGHRAWSARLGKSRLQLDMDKMNKLCKELVPSESDNEDLFIQVLGLARAAKSSGLVPAGAPMGVKGIVPDTASAWEDLAFAKGYLDVDDEAIFWAKQVVLKSINQSFQGLIDFDDQIYMSVLFGGQYPRHHTVIIDEAQDLSPLNHKQIARLVGTRAIVVGDPYQAIYGFRGADSDSINNLVSEVGKKFETLQLSKSFRVPKAISARQTEWVPDFGSMDFLDEGSIEQWPLPFDGPGDAAQLQPKTEWSLDAIPQHGAVLCRNNAPLMRLAFAMIKSKRPVKILGRDIGASIARLLLKITGKTPKPIGECYPLLEAWRAKEVEKAGDSESKIDVIQDQYEAIHVLLEAGDKKTNVEAAEFIKDLFTDKEDGFKTTFASIHRSKGLEWDWVMMLDPFRIPSQQAVKADRNGDPRPLQQENNLKYVGETRSKNVLVFANVQDCAECGE